MNFKFTHFLVATLLSFTPSLSEARELTILFLGNSFTYFSGTPEDPGLPKMLKEVARSIDPDLNLIPSHHTPPGYTLQMHLDHPRSQELLSRTYDHVILQGHSRESLELTPHDTEKGAADVKGFSRSLPEILRRAYENNTQVTLFVNWGWSFLHPALQEGHPGLRFPEGHPRAGKKWCGESEKELQDMINASYQKHAQPYSPGFAFVGSEWLNLKRKNIVTDENLYVPEDWYHPSPAGTFVTALVLARDALHLDISRNQFIPEGMSSSRAVQIRTTLSLPQLAETR